MKVVGQFFADDGGKALMLVGSSDYSPLHLGAAFWKPGLEAMKGKANYVRIGMSGIDGKGYNNPYVRVSGSGLTSGGFGEKFDLTKFSPFFFKMFKDFMTMANSYGIVVHVSFFNEIFIKNKTGCGFRRNLFGNGNHINKDLIGDVDRKNGGSGMGSDGFYDLAALNGQTWDLKRKAVAAIQKKFVTKIVTIGNSFPNIIYEIGNEVSDMAWSQYWVNFVRELSTAPVTINAATTAYKAITPTEGLTFHRIDYNFGKGQSVVMGLDSDGAGIDPADPKIQRQIAWKSLTTGKGIYSNYAETVIRKTTLRGFAFSNDKRLLEQYFYFQSMKLILDNANIRLGIMQHHPELLPDNENFCLAKPGRQYLIYTDGKRTIRLNTSGFPYKFRVRIYNSLSGDLRSDKKINGGTILSLEADVGDVICINRIMK
jgi:hypothetical protein